METVLKRYNKLSATHLSTMQELEEISEIIHSDTIGATPLEIFLRRFYSFCAEDEKHNLHRIYYYTLETGKLDEHGSVTGDLVTLEYGLL